MGGILPTVQRSALPHPPSTHGVVGGDVNTLDDIAVAAIRHENVNGSTTDSERKDHAVQINTQLDANHSSAVQAEIESVHQISRDTAGKSNDKTVLHRHTNPTKLQEEYGENCPDLAEEDTEGYPSDGDEELDHKVYYVEATTVENVAAVLEEILPYIKMAIAAYSDENMQQSIHEVKRCQIIRNVINPSHLFGVGRTDTEVHVLILQDDSVVFAFRGTEPTVWRTGFGDILTDIAAGQAPVELYNGAGGPVYTSKLLRVHYGFQAALMDVTRSDEPTENLMHVVKNLGVDAGNVRRVVCVGHSLGGALATLCAKWCREVGFPRAEIGCVTIGSPRVGNVEFAKDFESRVVKGGLSYRVVNKRDVVPEVPNLISYIAMSGSKYKHVQRAIYLGDEEGVTPIVGGRRPSWVNLGFLDHSSLAYATAVEAVLAAHKVRLVEHPHRPHAHPHRPHSQEAAD